MAYQCECIDCGYEMESEDHCRDTECPECGGEMRRAERPGPGAKAEEKPKEDNKMRIQNRSPFKPRNAKYRIENKVTEKEATVYIYDEISWFGIDAEQFIKDLNDITAKTINIRFNSPGGSVFDGTAVFNAIKQHKSKTVSHIDGLAASISSVIALASNEIRMAENAFLMIHDPWGIVIGGADVMREEADLLDKIGGTIRKTYSDKTGKDDKEIKKLMTAETWMTADEALEMGFIDVIDKTEEEDEGKAKASLFDLSVFAKGEEMAKIIEEKQGSKQDPNERDAEKALREAGFSRNQAKQILAKGFKGDLNEREAQEEARLQAEREALAAEETRLREAEEANKAEKPPKKKDRTAELLTKGEELAPTRHAKIKEVLEK